ncbi:hypothetical protein [Stenotrophomonas phage BUCT555]|nr:hypothetical protein [Stenotrophomonas phage BUCT555]
MNETVALWDVLKVVLTMGAPALVVWVWSLWREVQNLKIKMIEEYAKLSMIKEMRDDMSHMRMDMSRIMDRLEIPAVRRDQ